MDELHAVERRFDRDLHRVFEAGGGVVTLVLLHTRASMSIVADAKRGDATAKIIVAAVSDLLERLENLEAGATTACLLCEASTLCSSTPPAGIGVLLPSIDVPRTAVGVALCPNCTSGRSQTELTAAIVAKLRAGTAPGLRDLRILPSLAQAGHA